ncbi:MAG: hypothetical protein PHI97_01720 [Desulfobulbus sp.]|nr:hypothetical protein [Desulfobulbus sp.]
MGQFINHVGLMLTKDEAPILRDMLEANLRYIKKVYVLDGGHDDSCKIFKEYPEIISYLHEDDLRAQLHEPLKVVDGIRGYLLDIIREHEKGDVWVTLMHGDEIFYHNPLEVVELAQISECNCVEWYAPHFFPHKKDYKEWGELLQKPLQERIRYYLW